jgi:hypothetical protein
VNRPRAADDFATIRAHMEEMRREREGPSPTTRTPSRTRRCRALMRSAGRHQGSARGREGSANLDNCALRSRAGLLISA